MAAAAGKKDGGHEGGLLAVREVDAVKTSQDGLFEEMGSPTRV